MVNKIDVTITAERVIQAVQDDESLGFCFACGADAYGVEPDARDYACEECGELAVHGAEETLLHLA